MTKFQENIYPIDDRLLSRSDREDTYGYKAMVFWLCGLSGSGKSTLAIGLEKFLFSKNIHAVVLDGDNLRSGVCKDLGFSLEDRMENIRRISEIAKILISNGHIPIVSLISPTIKIRETAKSIIGDDDFNEIFVKSSFQKCQDRDVKGLYAKSDQGNLASFSGKDSVFEEPTNPWLEIDTENETHLQSMTKLCDAVLGKIQ